MVSGLVWALATVVVFWVEFEVADEFAGCRVDDSDVFPMCIRCSRRQRNRPEPWSISGFDSCRASWRSVVKDWACPTTCTMYWQWVVRSRKQSTAVDRSTTQHGARRLPTLQPMSSKTDRAGSARGIRLRVAGRIGRSRMSGRRSAPLRDA